MDPLRPFATLIRSLWASKQRTSITQRTTSAGTAAQAAATFSVESRLRVRLRSLSPWHASRAREIFVETVLLHELGSQLDTDPDFQTLVREVSAHLASVQGVGGRLDEVLQDLQRGRSR